jgi:hypothetical protein
MSLYLFQVGSAGPHGGVRGHIVVGGEQLHLGLARVYHVYHVVDSDRRLRYVR